MSSTTLKKFCQLSKFIKVNDKNFYQALDDLCLLGLLRPRDSGITFLYPTDKTYRAKIISSAYSNTPEIAVDLFKSLILLDYLDSPSNFDGKEISNALYKKIEVDSVTNNSVTLKSKHVLTINSSYVPLRKSDKIVVYNLKGSGMLPTTGAQTSINFSNASKKNNESVGGSDAKTLAHLADHVEKYYMINQTNCCVYRAFLSFIYEYMCGKNSDEKSLVYNRMCASARASFYHIVQPYYSDKDTDLVSVIQNSGLCNICNYPIDKMNTFVNKYSSSYSLNLENFISSCKSNISTNLKDRYDEQLKIFKTSDSVINARTNVLNAYKTDPKKLFGDLLTMYCYQSYLNETNDSQYFKTTFLFNMKNIYTTYKSFNSATPELIYLYQMFYDLIKSDSFKYVPVSKREDLPEYKDFKTDLPDHTNNDFVTIQFNELFISMSGGDNITNDTPFDNVMNNL